MEVFKKAYLPPPKTPGAKLDYVFDWKARTNGRDADLKAGDWLEDDEVIASYTITSDAGITLEENYLIDGATAIRVWLSDGTLDIDYRVAAHITTNSDPARKDTRTMLIRVRER